MRRALVPLCPCVEVMRGHGRSRLVLPLAPRLRTSLGPPSGVLLDHLLVVPPGFAHNEILRDERASMCAQMSVLAF